MIHQHAANGPTSDIDERSNADQDQAGTVDRARRRWLCAAPALLLIGCSRGRRLGAVLAPRISLAGLETESGNWSVRLRVQNVSDRIMTIERIDLSLLSGGHRLPLDLRAQHILLPPYATDVVTVSTQPQPGFVEQLRRSTAQPGGAAYRLEGQLHTTDPIRRFELEYEGFLSAVPGREGRYR